MRKLLPLTFLIILSCCLCGCPYDSPFNLDESPAQNIDESLLGKWNTISQNSRDIEIAFDKRTDLDYDIVITGDIGDLKPYHIITNDSIKGTGYLSTIAGKQFLNTYIGGKVYIAEIIKDSTSLSVLPLAEYFTSKLIKSSRELRVAVEFHYKIKLTPAYDHTFSLKNLQRSY